MGKLLEKTEIRYILYAMGFSVIWFFVLMPYLINSGIENSSPYLQFLIFNVGLFLFLTLFLKFLALKRKIKWDNVFGMLAMFTAIDILTPPFLVDLSGKLLNSVVLKSSGADYIVGHFVINTLNFSGWIVFAITYVLAPALLLLLSALLLKDFVRKI